MHSTLLSAALGFMLIFSTSLFSQINNIGTITGIIIDESTKRPLVQVNVVLYNTSDSTIVTGIVTDKDGKFDLANIPIGEYFLKFKLISYKEKATRSFVIDQQHRKLNVGTVALTETAVSLDEVITSANKSIYNNAIDRKVYNVDQDVMGKAGSASELLQNVPSVQVDIDGNVSLRGSEDVLIMINGRTNPMMGKNRATVLEQMPANSIEKIEVITNPSAKYKPDGTSGIINIVLKNGSELGINGSLTGNLGNNDRYNGNLRLNYNPGTLNLFGSYSVRKDNRNRVNSDVRIQTDAAAAQTLYNEDLFSYASPLSHMFALGAEYKPDRANSFGISGDFFFNSFTRTENASNLYRTAGGSVIESYQRDRYDPEFENEYNVTSFFEHDFSKEDQTLRVEFNSSHSPEEEDNHYTNIFSFPSPSTEYDNTRIKQGEDKNQLSIDYADPLGGDASLETGYAGEYNAADLDYRAEYFNPAAGNFVLDIAKTNRFLSDDWLHAFYVTYKKSFGNFGVKGGMRAEQAYIRSNLVTLDSVVSTRYFSLYPTFHASYKMNEAAEIQLNYSRRTNRPDGDDLNPFPEYRDARNLSAGNPYLLPEYIHSVEFGCQVQTDNFSVLPAVYYRYTYNKFTSITEAINDTVLLTTEQNLSTDRATGLELILTGNMKDKFQAHFSANGFYNQIDASNLGYAQNKSIFTWSSALTFTANITQSTIAQINSNYRSARLSPQGEYEPSYVVNVGARQELAEGKMSLTMTVTDLFKTQQRKLELNTPFLTETSVNTRDSRIFYIGFTYRFGAPPKNNKEEQMKYDDGV